MKTLLHVCRWGENVAPVTTDSLNRNDMYKEHWELKAATFNI